MSERNWRHCGVRVLDRSSFDSDTLQTPGMARSAAITRERAGARNLWAGTVRVDPDARTGAHHHGETESAIYVVKGRARMRWGERLEYVTEAGPGDFIYVPPYVPHQEMNASPSDPLECVIVRTGHDPVVVNLEIPTVETPEEVRWLDSMHSDEGGASKASGPGDTGAPSGCHTICRPTHRPDPNDRTPAGTAAHWNAVYGSRAPSTVSWFQANATPSLELIARAGVPLTAPILDVGAGASTLVDGLLARGYRDLTLLDVSERAFLETRRRLGSTGPDVVRYVVSDVTRWTPDRPVELWHDRAVFHFLTEDRSRASYRSVLASSLARGSHAIVATFAPDGPERCSGLPVGRYSADTLAAEFEGVLQLVEDQRVNHSTPWGAVQPFVFARFVRI